jgi:hypothetical protein
MDPVDIEASFQSSKCRSIFTNFLCWGNGIKLRCVIGVAADCDFARAKAASFMALLSTRWSVVLHLTAPLKLRPGKIAAFERVLHSSR